VRPQGSNRSGARRTSAPPYRRWASASQADGDHVRFLLDDLLSIAALECRRNKCAVIGEDLGTVREFRQRADRELELGGLLDRKVRGLCPL
jgi:4-alpha-glucanotransferase